MPVNKIRRNGSYAPLSAHYYKDDAIDEAGEPAELLYVRGLAFCADVLSDGFISERQLVRFVGVGMFDAQDRASRLVEVGLWDRVDGGFQVRSWLNWNRSRDEITDAQAKDSARKASSRTSDDPDPKPPTGGRKRTGRDSDRNPDGIRTESERTGERNPNGVQPHAGAHARTPLHSTPRNSNSTTDLSGQAGPADAGDLADPGPVDDGLDDDGQTALIPAITPRKRAEPPSLFDDFWALYPKKVKKQNAVDSWQRKVLDKRIDQAEVLTALRAQIVTWQNDPQFPKFVPDPPTWLNQARWHDEINPSPLKAVSGGYQAWRNPTDQSVYDEDFYPRQESS